MSQTLCSSPPAGRAAIPAAAVAALLVATGAWGSLFFVGKAVLEDVDPLWFTTIRYAAAAVLLLALHPLFGRARMSQVLALAPRLAAYGLAGYGAFSVLVFIGLSLSSPSHGAVIMATMPVSTVLLRWVQDGDRPSAPAVAACALAMAGVASVSGLVAGHGTAGSALGHLLAFAGTLGWITYTRGAAQFPQLSAFDYTAFTAWVAAPVLLVAAAMASAAGVVDWPAAAAVARHGAAFAYVAALPTVAAAVAFNFGVRTLGAATGTLFLNAVPVSAMAIATALGHPPAATELAGAALVGAALVLATRR